MEQENLRKRIEELEIEVGRLRDAEKLLRIEKAYLELLLDSAPEAIIMADRESRITRINPQFTKMFGYTFEEALGKSADDLIAAGERHPEASRVTGLVHSGEQVRFESTRFRKDGTAVYVEGMAVPVMEVGGHIGAFVSYRDITDRKKAEDELREAEERYRSLFENSPVGIGIATTDGRLLDFNAAILKPGGFEREDIGPKKRISDFYYDIRERERIVELATRHGFLERCEVRLKRKDGSPYDALLSLRPLRFKGEPCWYAIVQDVTEQKKAERAAKESEGKYRDLVENANSIVLRWNPRGRILYMNRFGLEFFGYREEEIIGRHAFETIIPERESTTGRDMRKLMMEIQSDPDRFRNNEHENVRKNGQRVWVLWANKAILDEEGKIEEVLSIGNDVTEKRSLQAQLFHAQKMEAIGTLAGGIAHDFNNLLMGIQGRTSLMLLECPSGHPFYDHLSGIEEHVESAAELTRQLLGFARGGKYQLNPSDLNALLRKSSEMFGRTKKEISIHTRYQEGIWTAEVDRGQIEQVFINLFVNAWQSMPGGGELFLESENVRLSGWGAKSLGLREERYVKVTITDTGEGMDERTRERIFDPFFTTKEMGRGTGLGLASAYGIIKNHGGTIQVQSRKGKGSSFFIYLPASEKEIVAEKVNREKLLKGNETVLLVDDEDMILEVALSMLTALGYKVLTAKSGQEAAELYRERWKKIDLVILDMIMPAMGGKETFEELRKINRDVRVLLSSGYSIDSRAKLLLEEGCRGFIQKPFNLSAFSSKLRDVLEG
ncbi:MAG: PAS domain-containing sensor histidine kinase [Desulfobacteraceae bacterium]|nr:MAG: PAS domain-containing sensor histidine kinase [Desulfobacteraceae bacterium]